MENIEIAREKAVKRIDENFIEIIKMCELYGLDFAFVSGEKFIAYIDAFRICGVLTLEEYIFLQKCSITLFLNKYNINENEF